MHFIVVYYDQEEGKNKIIIPSNVDVLMSNGEVIKIDKTTTTETTTTTTTSTTQVISDPKKTTAASPTTMSPNMYSENVESTFKKLIKK